MIMVFVFGGTLAAKADEKVEAVGRILASDGKTPLADAMIAVYDEQGKVIAHGKTDSEGRYRIPVSREDLHLVKRRKGGGFLGGLFKGVGNIVNVAAGFAPMMLTGGLSGLAGGGLSGLAGGNPLGAASGLIGGGKGPLGALSGAVGGGFPGFPGGKLPGGMTGITPEMMKMMSQGGMPGGDYLSKLMAQYGGMDGEMGGGEPAANSPGALPFRVTLAGHMEVGGVSQVYWMQEEPIEENGKKKSRTVAWVDPIWLAKTGEEAPSRIVRGFFAFQDAAIDPAIVEIGRNVTLAVKLPLPDEPKVDVIVVARNSKTGEIWQLDPAGDGVFKAEIPVDKKGFGKDDQTISVLAYAADPATPGRNKKAEDAIKGLWKLDKPYEYNPKIVASRNRVDLRLTVVEPAKPR